MKINLTFLSKKKFLPEAGNVKEALIFLARHIFSLIILLILADLALGAFLSYKYAVLADSKPPLDNAGNFKFQEDSFKSILAKIKEREEFFSSSGQKNYPSPFPPAK